MSFVNDEQFGHIVDFEKIRKEIRQVYDHIYPNFNLLASVETCIEISKRNTSYATSIGASALSYCVLVAAEEYEYAEKLKDCIFTLGWTEEHTGTDLLSLRTQATPASDDPNERNYHIKGSKWIINCSYHADYHIALAKVNPELDGPRSISFFLIPHSSTKNWERIQTHVMREMVLTKFEIDGPGILLGKVGHALSYLQRMAIPSKYECAYLGINMLYNSLPATLAHLDRKKIFGNNPIRFSNVFRQMYDMCLKAAFYDFMFHRSIVFNGNGFLQVYGTMLKSYLLLRIHELLDKNLLVAGSIGFTRDSVIGRDAQDSAVLPVFDGHYTLNTLITAKHMERYVSATLKANPQERLEQLRTELFQRIPKNEIAHNTQEVRKPAFFDYADYIQHLDIPFAIDPQQLMDTVRSILDEVKDRDLTNDPEYNYKTGDLLHWLEAFLAACEMWRLYGDQYANIIAIQYNALAHMVNEMIAEGGMTTEFLTPVRLHAIPDNLEDPAEYLRDLLDIRTKIQQPALTY
jgi:alkylation response protein AidB-like acyl-CoA dehydrogenase